MINTDCIGHAQASDAGNAPTEPTFDEEAEHLLERAATQLRHLHQRNLLLQMKSDTVDQLCSLGKAPPQYGNSVVGMSDEPSVLYRIESLLRRRNEAREAESRKAGAAILAAATANARPDPCSTPLGF